MGLLDIFKKKPARINDEPQPTVGWDAITDACEKVYPTQKDPKHYGTIISWNLGGNDPLDGISIYDGGTFWHFVTYGLSELYGKESKNKKISGYGMEFTFKLRKDTYQDEEGEIRCVCGILQALARITFTKGELFHPYEYIYTGQTQGIDSNMQSNITGFITVPDRELAPITTPNGSVSFVEFIGVTNTELLAVKNKQLDVQTLYNMLGDDITSYSRSSVI